MALRISNVDPERAKEEGEAALNNEYGLLESNEDNMQTVPKYASTSIGGEDSGGDENGIAMCSVAYNGEFVLSWDMEQFYRNLSTGGAEYTIKTGRTGSTTKIIDPRCLKCWFRAKMTSETLAAGEESLREDYVGCHRNAQDDEVSMSERIRVSRGIIFCMGAVGSVIKPMMRRTSSPPCTRVKRACRVFSWAFISGIIM